MALTLLRHTLPDVAEGVCYGRRDLALADGFEAECATVLAGLEPPTAIVTSPLWRCRILAERVSDRFEVPLTVSPDFIEMDFGTWEGQRWDAIGRAALNAWADDFLDYAGHGGESVAQLQKRVARGLHSLPDGALVVTHAGVIKAALALKGDAAGWEHRAAFGSLVRI